MVYAKYPSVPMMLKKDAIGVCPTDTLYGIVGSATSKKAVERIYRVKGRSEGKPLIILIDSIDDIEQFCGELREDHVAFLNSVWPGPVSVILPCYIPKFKYLHRGTKSIAFRMPKNPSLRAFLRRTGPLAAPSANPQGLKPAHTITEAKNYFKDKVDFYIPGGRKDGKASKVISLLTGKPEVIRK